MNREAFRKISYGLYVVSSIQDGKFNGQIANSMFQVTSEPSTIAVSIAKENLTHAYIASSRVFSVSILAEDTPMTFIGLFGFKSGRDTDKFKNLKHRIGKTGAPIVLDHAVAYLEAKVVQELECGSHTIFVGEVADYDSLGNEAPMTYSYYHTVRKGKAPKTAPTYEREEPRATAAASRYVCTLCGYVYDPALGDPESGVPAGRAFEDLPADWTCPVCGAGKDQFEPEQ
ncbi:MAG: flavin reductase [Pseudomonadota bacterium]|nr:flavin reductase [Pseudomonadota bacterium]